MTDPRTRRPHNLAVSNLPPTTEAERDPTAVARFELEMAHERVREAEVRVEHYRQEVAALADRAPSVELRESNERIRTALADGVAVLARHTAAPLGARPMLPEHARAHRPVVADTPKGPKVVGPYHEGKTRFAKDYEIITGSFSGDARIVTAVRSRIEPILALLDVAEKLDALALEEQREQLPTALKKAEHELTSARRELVQREQNAKRIAANIAQFVKEHLTPEPNERTPEPNNYPRLEAGPSVNLEPKEIEQ